MIRKAKAVWRGNKRAGDGDLRTDSGTFEEIYYSFTMRFGNQGGTNTEGLIAAARAGCSTKGLAFLAAGGELHANRCQYRVGRFSGPGKLGLWYQRSAPPLRAKVPNLAKAAAAEFT
jgi:organic hydroperoxide reductase OsmC/OhrA